MNYFNLNQITDDDIVKAFLFCKCSGEGSCKDCRFDKGEDDASCIKDLMNAVYALINNQKAKIEALKMDNEQLHSDIVNLTQSLDHVTGLWEEEKEKVAKAKQKVIDSYKMLKTAKSEARKEFADRLKEELDDFYYSGEDSILCTLWMIDDALKELEGGNDEENT